MSKKRYPVYLPVIFIEPIIFCTAGHCLLVPLGRIANALERLAEQWDNMRLSGIG
jgi:hypothetical protein